MFDVLYLQSTRTPVCVRTHVHVLKKLKIKKIVLKCQVWWLESVVKKNARIELGIESKD